MSFWATVIIASYTQAARASSLPGLTEAEPASTNSVMTHAYLNSFDCLTSACKLNANGTVPNPARSTGGLAAFFAKIKKISY